MCVCVPHLLGHIEANAPDFKCDINSTANRMTQAANRLPVGRRDVEDGERMKGNKRGQKHSPRSSAGTETKMGDWMN